MTRSKHSRRRQRGVGPEQKDNGNGNSPSEEGLTGQGGVPQGWIRSGQGLFSTGQGFSIGPGQGDGSRWVRSGQGWRSQDGSVFVGPGGSGVANSGTGHIVEGHYFTIRY